MLFAVSLLFCLFPSQVKEPNRFNVSWWSCEVASDKCSPGTTSLFTSHQYLVRSSWRCFVRILGASSTLLFVLKRLSQTPAFGIDWASKLFQHFLWFFFFLIENQLRSTTWNCCCQEICKKKTKKNLLKASSTIIVYWLKLGKSF